MGIDPTILFQVKKKVAEDDAVIIKSYETITLCEKCPNTKLFL